MEQNKFTIQELQKKIWDIIEDSFEISISEEELMNNGISFKSVLDHYDRKTLYFYCLDGIAQVLMGLDSTSNHYITQYQLLSKLDQNQLDKIASEYFKSKETADTLGCILEVEKVRGLFAKMKASK